MYGLRRAGAAMLAAAIAVGCDGAPQVALDDASTPRRRTGDGGVFLRPIDPNDLGDLPSVGVPPGSPPERVSPPTCPGPDDPTFCTDCYRWTDEGPDSLGRNDVGEAFGQVSTGDFNEDGYPDLAVGVAAAQEHDAEGGSGEVFVYLGSTDGFLPFRRLWWPGIEWLGLLTAVGDFDGDGHHDIAAVYSGDLGGLVTFMGDGAGGFSTGIIVDAASLEDPNGDPQTAWGFGWALAVGDLDGDDSDDIAAGVSDWEGVGAVYLIYGSGDRAWISYDDTGGTASYERFGVSLAVGRLPGIATDLLLVGAPESEAVYEFVYELSHLVLLGSLEPSSPTTGFGTTVLASHDAIAVGSSTGVVEVFLSESSRVLTYPPFSGDSRLIAIADTNDDGRIELFGAEDPWSSGPGQIFAWFGIEAAGAAPELLYLDSTPTRVSGDGVGIQSAVADWDGDGFDDVALGAPALLSSSSPGQLFGYYGRAEPRAPDDNTFDFEDSHFRLDQETPACDRCQAFDLPDGTICSLGFCLAGECTARTGCGDGWPEAGPSPTREGCDDRNAVDGDACSSTCEPTAFVVASRAGAVDAPSSGRTVALDGTGAALVVWVAELDAATEVRARRYTRYGVEADPAEDEAPIVLASMPGPGWDPQPVVAGLPGGGWRVAWAQSAGAEVSTVAMRDVQPDGTMSTGVEASGARDVHASDPALLAFENGAAVLWTDASDPASPRVMFRLVDDAGRPAGDPMPFDTRPGSGPVVAMTPDGALIAWVRPPAVLGERSRIVGVRYGEGPIDPEPFEIGSGIGPVAIAARDTDLAVAWVGHGLDPAGDVYVRRIAASGSPLVHAATRVTGRDSLDRPHAELRPSLAFRSDGWIVGWEEPTERRVALAGETSLPPEYAAYLEPELRDGYQRHLSLTSSSRGVWVIWSSTVDEPPIEQMELVADADAYVNEATPNTAYGTSNILRVGRLGDTSGGTGRKDAYFHWNIDALVGMSVVSARMRFSQNDGYIEPLGASFYRAAGPWTEAALTWTTRVAPQGTALASVVMPTLMEDSGLFEIDGTAVTDTVREWVAYSGSNHGIVVQLNDREANVIGGDSLTSREHSVAGRRPTLIVDYQRPTAARATWGFILPPH